MEKTPGGAKHDGAHGEDVDRSVAAILRTRQASRCGYQQVGLEVEGPILMVKRDDPPDKRVRKEQTRVGRREQDDLLALTRGSLRPGETGVGRRAAGPRLRQPLPW